MGKTLKLNMADNSAKKTEQPKDTAEKRVNINSSLTKGMNSNMKTNITSGMAAEKASRCENSTPASRRSMLNSSVARKPLANRSIRRNALLNSSTRQERPAMPRPSRRPLNSNVAPMARPMNRDRFEDDECEMNSSRRPMRPARRPMLNSSARRPARRPLADRPILNSSVARRPMEGRPLASRPVLNSNRQSLREMLERAHASRLNSSLRPMPRRKLNSSEEDIFDDGEFDVTETEITETEVPAEEPAVEEGAVDVTELLIVQDPESKEISLFIQDDEDETLPESVEVIAAVEPATEADLNSACGGKKKLNSSEEDGAENAADETTEGEAETTEEVEIELPDGDTVEVEDIYVVQSEDGELDLFIAEEGAELPEAVEVVGEAVAVDESEVLDSSRKMIKRAGNKLNSNKDEKADNSRQVRKVNCGSNANKSYKELKSIYAWLLKNYPDASSAIGYDNIGYSEASYKKVGNKWSEIGTENDKVDWEFYFNTMDAVPTFRNMGGKEKVEVKYTKVGKVPFRVTSINPDGTEKIVREFNFNDIKRIKDDSEKLDSSCDNKKKLSNNLNSGVASNDADKAQAVKILSKVYADGANIQSTIRDTIKLKFAKQFGFNSVAEWDNYIAQFNTNNELFDSFTTPALLDAVDKFGYSRSMNYRNLGQI